LACSKTGGDAKMIQVLTCVVLAIKQSVGDVKNFFESC